MNAYDMLVRLTVKHWTILKNEMMLNCCPLYSPVLQTSTPLRFRGSYSFLLLKYLKSCQLALYFSSSNFSLLSSIFLLLSDFFNKNLESIFHFIFVKPLLFDIVYDVWLTSYGFLRFCTVMLSCRSHLQWFIA